MVIRRRSGLAATPPPIRGESGGPTDGLACRQLLRDVVESLRDREGVYLRCVAEEYSAFTDGYRYESDRGDIHREWLAASVVFGEFLVGAQEKDGSWFRAYDFDGRAITSPESSKR